MTKRITLDDIAAAAHVSKATVSKALNDTGQLSAHTRRLILKTADELGYVKTAMFRHHVAKPDSSVW